MVEGLIGLIVLQPLDRAMNYPASCQVIEFRNLSSILSDSPLSTNWTPQVKTYG